MKTLYLLSFLFLSATLYYSFQSEEKGEYLNYHDRTVLNTGGPSGGLTGAPGENNCTNCHAGSVQDGNNGINLLTFIEGNENFSAGASNAMRLSFEEGAAKNGFQLVVLDQDNQMAGNFSISQSNATQLRTSSIGGQQRQYITHTAAGTAASEWEFDWEAPTGLTEATFYIATNRTNSNNGSSGDVIYLSSHTVTSENGDEDGDNGDDDDDNGDDDNGVDDGDNGDDDDSTVGLENNEISDLLDFNYVPGTHQLYVSIADDFPMGNNSINIVNMQGQSVYFQKLTFQEMSSDKEIIPLPQNMNNGIYIITVFSNNTPYSKKVMIQR